MIASPETIDGICNLERCRAAAVPRVHVGASGDQGLDDNMASPAVMVVESACNLHERRRAVLVLRVHVRAGGD